MSPPVDPRVALLGGKDKQSPSKSIPLEIVGRGRANTIPTVYGRTSTQEENELREQLKSRLKSSQALFTYQRNWVSRATFKYMSY
jgi:hypothetical protein